MGPFNKKKDEGNQTEKMVNEKVLNRQRNGEKDQGTKRQRDKEKKRLRDKVKKSREE